MTDNAPYHKYDDTRALAVVDLDPGPLIALATTNLASAHSQRAYEFAIRDFLTWWTQGGRPPLSKFVVEAWASDRRRGGRAAPSVQRDMSALRKTFREAADAGIIGSDLAAALCRAKAPREKGKRLGQWLSEAQAQDLLDAPSRTTPEGQRDAAILALLLGCWLRRSEAASLPLDIIQQRDGRWVIVDLVGKGERIRSVPMPAWTKAYVDRWTTRARIQSGPLFRPISQGGRIYTTAVSDQTIADIVHKHGAAISMDLDAHDLRRTGAKRALAKGAPIEQISVTLGHASIRTTQIYLGVELDLADAATDYFKLK